MGILYRGKDFRTSFEKIGSLRAFTDVPFMALTASAPADIEATIVNSLHLESPVFIRGDVDRPNSRHKEFKCKLWHEACVSEINRCA